MLKLFFPKKHVLIILCLIFFFMLHQAQAADSNQQETTLDVRACNMSDILTKMCQAKNIKISMNKIIKKQVPCDYKGSGDIDASIKYLLARENCAVIWNYKANRLASVNILFFDNSSRDTNDMRRDLLAMKKQSHQPLTFPSPDMEYPGSPMNVPQLPTDPAQEAPFPQ